MLGKYNIQTTLVESGQACIDLIEGAKASYDLIFLDDMMPGMRGVDVLKHLIETNDFHIPTVALTANAIEGMSDKYIELGFDEYLAKPIEKVKLETILIKYLKKSTITAVPSIADYSGKKVLIVDDNKMNVKVIKNILNKMKFETFETYSGFEALNNLRENKYDLILLDYMMPEMDGIETLHKMKEIPEFETKVVCITADAVTGSREKFLKAGFDEYIAKPTNRNELAKILKSII